MEILAFVIIGIIAGLAAANFVIFHKYLAKQVTKMFKTVNQQTYIYPTLCALIYSTLTFPGRFLTRRFLCTRKRAIAIIHPPKFGQV